MNSYDTQQLPSEEPSINTKAIPPSSLAIFIIGLVIGVVLGAVGMTLFSSRSGVTTTVEQVDPAAPGQPAAAETNNRPTLMDAAIEQTRHFKGDPNAPITIIEFSDFKCGYCGRFATEAGQQIEEQYIKTGVVRFGYQSIAILTPESQHAAEASECAADQNAFWEYHDLLFERLGSGQGDFSRENLKQYAAELGLDRSAFNACMDTEKYADAVQNQTIAASSMGVQSTPTFIINGQPFVGAQPFEAFQRVIEAERAAGGG